MCFGKETTQANWLANFATVDRVDMFWREEWPSKLSVLITSDARDNGCTRLLK